MPKFSSKRRVRHTAPQMFDLVADVERYPEFVPLCHSLKIRQRTPQPDGTEIVIADMREQGFITEGMAKAALHRALIEMLAMRVPDPLAAGEPAPTVEGPGMTDQPRPTFDHRLIDTADTVERS